jgi:heme exporter protein C
MTSKDKTFYALAAAFAAAVSYAIFTIFLRTPTAQVAAGGLAQKIFYFYSGVTMGIYVTGGACLLASALYLVRPSEAANAWARAGSDCAALFGILVLCSGPFWHKKASGVYWLWELQLTTTVLSVLVYWAICLLRAFADEGAAERRFAAALGVMGTINLPIIYYAVQKWGGGHPPVIREGGGLGPAMRPAFSWAAISMTILLPSLLLWLRSRLHVLQASLEHTRQEALARGLAGSADDVESLESGLPQAQAPR